MIPFWMLPLALVCGNTMILAPLERDPGAAMILMKLTKEGKYVYERGSKNVKRVQCNMLVGAAGQPCMALSTAVSGFTERSWTCHITWKPKREFAI
ncbi:probable methylmalonate-semialdehyde dehydrogenase [acylating], mitochondrial isoform X2 [Argiope bruennichi]|uniref:probable methylmalonate-semialdehyde dehydrogenase [acylating], mitochondrial isoform X2 n=1 Tax=Argiope bruennichi TaxID=94029 RepID=UPI00249538D7|nr:probable methylmalonate-semialdehyde dehydrogenase [acylating], mitochondrial isoform X2 [Argiope bruennichi]